MSIQGVVMRAIQEYRYRDITINLICKRCHYKGNHKFAFIYESPATILLTWGFVYTKKIFKCEKCGVLMFENGELVVTIFDRLDGFIHYPELRDAINELELMVAQNQDIASKYREEIIDLKKDLADANADIDFIVKKLKSLNIRINQETA